MPTPDSSVPVPRHRAATTLLALAVPLAVLALSVLLVMSWQAELPDPVATHWGPDGVDGFSSLRTLLIASSAVSALIVIAFWAAGLWLGRTASTRRIINATSAWVATLFAAILFLTLDAQRGLGDASEVGDVGGLIVLALVAASVVGLVIALVTPDDTKSPAEASPPSDAKRIPLNDSERAVWVARAVSLPTLLIGSGGIAIGLIVMILTQQFWLLVGLALLILVITSMSIWTVKVDATGLTVRSVLKNPRTHQPISEIVRTDVVSIRALREFGGWGWRVGKDGRSGIVLRSGDALQVTRTAGRVFVVTVSNPAAGAALLNTYADRNR